MHTCVHIYVYMRAGKRAYICIYACRYAFIRTCYFMQTPVVCLCSTFFEQVVLDIINYDEAI